MGVFLLNKLNVFLGKPVKVYCPTSVLMSHVFFSMFSRRRVRFRYTHCCSTGFSHAGKPFLRFMRFPVGTLVPVCVVLCACCCFELLCEILQAPFIQESRFVYWYPFASKSVDAACVQGEQPHKLTASVLHCLQFVKCSVSSVNDLESSFLHFLSKRLGNRDLYWHVNMKN